MSSDSFMANLQQVQLNLPVFDANWAASIQAHVAQHTDRINDTSASIIHHAMGSFMEAFKTYHLETMQVLASHIATVATEIQGQAPVKAEFEITQALVQTNTALLNHLNHQVQQLPISQGQGGSRQPKIGEPLEYHGSEGKISFEEWLDKITLWLVHERIVTDKQRIAVAVGKLSGPAAKYMKPWIKELGKDNTLGTWEQFVRELETQYGQRDEKEGAKKELTALFNNKNLAQKNFVKYAEHFRTLGRISGYEDNLLIDKLDNVVEHDLCLVLVGYKTNNTYPEGWMEYLDMLLHLYKQIHPEKAEGRIFSKGNEDDSVPMDIDSSEKKKKFKKKGKEVNSTNKDTKEKYCHICKMQNHSTEDCRYNGKNAGKQPQTSEKKKEGAEGKKGGMSGPKKKDIRVAEVSDGSDSSDDEDKSPKASSSKTKINSAELKTAYIKEVDSDDEPLDSPPSFGKGKGKKSLGAKDFLRRTM